MVQIPLEAHVNQQFMVVLDEQDCTIALYQRGRRMYCDLTVGSEAVCNGAIILGGVGIVRVAQNVFSGQLYMVDSLSGDGKKQHAPQWEELGSRYLLFYATADEQEEIEDYLFEEALNG